MVGSFLLTLNKKHALRMDRRTSMKMLDEAIGNFANRIRGSCMFRDRPPNPWRHLMTRKDEVVRCPTPLYEAKEMVLSRVAADLFE